MEIMGNINVRSFIAHRISQPCYFWQSGYTSQAFVQLLWMSSQLSLGGFLQGQKLSIELNFIVRETLSQRTHQTYSLLIQRVYERSSTCALSMCAIVTILNSGVLNVKAHAVQQITKCSVKGMNHIQI
ncbi:Hypothetical_protein [Hexamita inflata]|uniref:Hypothetical_protein n=1 Tax=Hexamita inflata TaxID=28002 RepID=A0AA86U3U1_9EUKA|nr:Hypothetical protein HINF_LOCUS24587 [Hexamita inflata]